MRQTSEDYAPFAQVRQVDCLISFEVLAKTLNKKNIVVTAPAAKLGNGAATINGMPELAAKYATLERYGWPLDGSCAVMPSSGIETGFWSAAVSDEAGDFSSPLVFRYDLPSDTDTFGWTFHFDAPAMITASRVKAVCYDAGGDVIDEAEGYMEGTDDPPRPTVTVGIEPVQAGSGDPSPDNVRPITGWTGAKVTRCGKNLFPNAGDITAVAALLYNYENPIIFKGQTVTISASSIEFGSGYTSSVIFFLKKNRRGIANISFTTTKNSGTWTATEDVYGLNFYATSQGSTNPGVTTIYHDVQIELGSTATAYEPYQGETYDITFPTEAGTVYGGTLDVTSGVLTVDRAMKVFSGNSSEGWVKSDYGYFTATAINDAINRNATPSDFQSNLFAYGAVLNNTSTLGACLIWRSVRVRLADMSISLDNWKAQLASNPMQVIYPLATPITYQLTPTEISRILDTDNVWADCGPVLEIGAAPGNRQEIKKTSSGWSFHHYVQGYRAVEFTFYGTNLPRRMLRLAEIDFGVSKHFSRDSIQKARIKYGMAPDGSAFPAKQIVFTFDNSDGEFNVLSPEGVYQYWRNGQVLTARIKVGDEIVPMGMFYVTKAEIGDNRLLAKVTAHDPCYQLANQKFYPSTLAEEEAVRLDEAVPRALIGTDLEVDYGGLEAELVSVAVRDTHDKRTILRYLAQAARATCWFDRDNVLRFRRIETADEEDGSITADELYGWSGVSIAEEYTGVTLTVHRELREGGEGGEDPTETYTAGIADDSGSAVASYDNPCVAAVNGQAVADWLLVMANRRKKYAVKNRCDPAVEIGDTLVIADAFRNDDRAVVTGLDIEYDGGLSCVTEADREF